MNKAEYTNSLGSKLLKWALLCLNV